MTETNEQPTGEDDLRQHSDAPAEGPTDEAEPEDTSDEIRQHAEKPSEG